MSDNLNARNLDETDPLEGDFDPAVAVESSDVNQGPPRVVIEYRSRGLPWAMVLPLLLLISLASIAGYHRVTRWLNPRSATVPTPASKTFDKPTETAEVQKPKPLPEPLTLSSQPTSAENIPARPISAGEFIGPPRQEAVIADGHPPRPIPPPDVKPGTSSLLVPEFRPTTLQVVMNMAKFPQVRPFPPADFRAPGPEEPEAPDHAEPGLKPVFDPNAKPVGHPKAADAKDAPKPHEGLEPPDDAPIREDVKQPDPVLPEPLPSREEVLAEIQKEAQKKQAELQEIGQAKNQSLEAAKEHRESELYGQRITFLNELQTLLREKKGRAGNEIEKLTARHENDVTPELRQEVVTLLRRASGRMSLKGKIRALRGLGVPEPAILDVICNEVHHRYHTTRCNCYSPQMYVLAARELLATELPPHAKPSRAPDQALPDHGDSKGARPVPRPASTSGGVNTRTQ
jgi:hypothetical protein